MADITKRAWQGLLRASFSSSPWNGTASAGGSGGRSASEVTAPPSTGLTQNSLVAARFDGVSNFLTASGTVGDYVGAACTAWTFECLLRWNSSVARGGTGIASEPCALSDNGGNWGVALTTDGITVGQLDGASTFKEVTSTTLTAASASIFLIQARFDGVNISVRVNRNAWFNTACTTFLAGVGGNTALIGKNFNGTKFLDADIFEWDLTDFALTDAQLDDDGIYFQERYALSLGFPYPILHRPSVDRIDRRQVNVRAHAARAQAYAGRVDPPVAALSLLQPNRRAQPDYTDRRQINVRTHVARMPGITSLSPLPIPTDTTTFAQMRAAYPDAVRRPVMRTANYDSFEVPPQQPPDTILVQYASFPERVPRPAVRAALQDAVELPPFQPPVVTVTPIGLTSYPDAVSSPSRRAVRDAGPAMVAQQIIPVIPGNEWPDTVPRPSLRTSQQQAAVLPPQQIAATMTPVALTSYPDTAPRPRFGAHMQLHIATLPQRERTAPLADVEYPDRVPRPAMRAAMQPWFALAPRPEQTIALGFQGRFPEAVRRPWMRSALQRSTTFWPLPIPDAPIVPDIVAHDTAEVWMLPRGSAVVARFARDTATVAMLPRSSAVIVRFARDTAEVQKGTHETAAAKVKGTK